MEYSYRIRQLSGAVCSIMRLPRETCSVPLVIRYGRMTKASSTGCEPKNADDDVVLMANEDVGGFVPLSYHSERIPQEASTAKLASMPA